MSWRREARRQFDRDLADAIRHRLRAGRLDPDVRYYLWVDMAGTAISEHDPGINVHRIPGRRLVLWLERHDAAAHRPADLWPRWLPLVFAGLVVLGAVVGLLVDGWAA